MDFQEETEVFKSRYKMVVMSSNCLRSPCFASPASIACLSAELEQPLHREEEMWAAQRPEDNQQHASAARELVLA